MNDGSPDAGRINWSNLLNAPQGPYSGDGFFLAKSKFDKCLSNRRKWFTDVQYI